MTSRTQFENIYFREIHKNAWLKKVIKKKKERLWVVFCVHDDTHAYLEAYADEKLAVMHKPDTYTHLNAVKHISPTICPIENEYEFVVTLSGDVEKYMAPKWEEMTDWVDSLQRKLQDLRLLSPNDNIYTKHIVTRDPNSPLPPPPNSAPTPNSHREVFNFDSLSLQETAAGGIASTNNCHYEHLFQQQQQPSDPGPSTPRDERQTVPLQRHRTFREQQVMQLQKEMRHPAGIRLQLRRKDCISSIALIGAFDSIWIGGWKQKEHPSLYNALHIGDKLVTVAGVPVRTPSEANQIFQSSGLIVEMIVQRMPHGRIFLIRREHEGQALGIVQRDGTAVIEQIETDSLVARHGITHCTQSMDGATLTNWVLTEINGRPLNLFYKKNQVRDRLNCVGKDISLLVQPFDLVKQIKKELKGLRYYKDYLLQ